MLIMPLVGEDKYILAAVAREMSGVESVLKWTSLHIPASKRQIAPYQAAVLAYYARSFNKAGARFLEIGTALGYSACVMATAAPWSTIVTLNPKDGEFERAVSNLRIRSNVIVAKMTSVDFKKSNAGGNYDIVFVDGDHAYNMIMHDAGFFNDLVEGGLILFHDYSPPESTRASAGSYQALNDLQESRRPAGVKVVGAGLVGMLGWFRRVGEVWD